MRRVLNLLFIVWMIGITAYVAKATSSYRFIGYDANGASISANADQLIIGNVPVSRHISVQQGRLVTTILLVSRYGTYTTTRPSTIDECDLWKRCVENRQSLCGDENDR